MSRLIEFLRARRGKVERAEAARDRMRDFGIKWVHHWQERATAAEGRPAAECFCGFDSTDCPKHDAQRSEDRALVLGEPCPYDGGEVLDGGHVGLCCSNGLKCKQPSPFRDRAERSET